MRRLVLGLGLGVLALIIVMVAWWLMRTHDETLDGGIAASRGMARAHAAYAARLLQSIDEANREIGAWFETGVPGPMIDTLLRQRRRASPFLMDLLVLDADGRIVHWSAEGPRPDVTDRPYYRAHLGSQRHDWHIDEPRPSRVHLGRWFFSFSRAFRAPDGSLARIVVAIIEAAYFDEMLLTLAAQPEASAVLSHETGRVIALSSDRGENGRGQLDTFAALAEGQKLDTAEAVGWRERVAAFPLMVSVRLEKAQLLVPWHGRVAVSLVALLLGGGTIVALSLLLVRKIDEMAHTEERYRALVEQSLVGIFYTHGSEFGYVNPRCAEIFGFAGPGDMRGRAFLDLVAEADRERVARQLERWREEAQMAEPVVFSALRGDGSPVELEAQARPVQIEGATTLLGVISDVTEKQRVERQLQFLAFHDPLTELPNRALFFDRLNQAICRGRREGGSFAVMVVDLDGFKEVNDSRGHDAGDAILRAVARRLQSCVRESDTVARTGGDEFVVVVHGVRQREDAAGLAAKIVEVASRPVQAPGGDAMVGASVGVVMFPADGVDMEALVSRADAAMYAAKKAGKNGYRFFDPGFDVVQAQHLPLLEWSDEHLMGVPIMDEQHQHLMALVNAVGRGVMHGDEPGRLREMMEDLVHFARLHFDTEETLMDAHGVPSADRHKQEHRRLMDDLVAILARFEDRSATMTVHAIKDWLPRHMMHSDRAMARFIVASGTH